MRKRVIGEKRKKPRFPNWSEKGGRKGRQIE